MLRKIRFRLIQLLAGRMGVMLNIRVEVNVRQRLIRVNGKESFGLIVANNIFHTQWKKVFINGFKLSTKGK